VCSSDLLLPEAELRTHWPEVSRLPNVFEILARRFKVSPIVVGRRAMDLRLVARQVFFDFYELYTARERSRKRSDTGGGDFYNNQNARVGRDFAIRVIRAAKKGRIGFKAAYDLTGLRGGTFQEYARRLGEGLV